MQQDWHKLSNALVSLPTQPKKSSSLRFGVGVGIEEMIGGAVDAGDEDGTEDVDGIGDEDKIGLICSVKMSSK